MSEYRTYLRQLRIARGMTQLDVSDTIGLPPRLVSAWEQGRMLQVQYHDIKSGDLEQFRGMDTQTVLTPSQYKTGDVIYPFEKARQ